MPTLIAQQPSDHPTSRSFKTVWVSLNGESAAVDSRRTPTKKRGVLQQVMPPENWPRALNRATIGGKALTAVHAEAGRQKALQGHTKPHSVLDEGLRGRHGHGRSSKPNPPANSKGNPGTEELTPGFWLLHRNTIPGGGYHGNAVNLRLNYRPSGAGPGRY